MSLIEKNFVKKTEGNETYRVLVNYWNCTRIQVPKILSCISQIFPHYTMHDVSHSNAILDSIERFLGPDTIDSLSVTDLWLLLCSAYCHDIGMYITGDEIKKCFDSDEFQKFVLDLKKDTESPLNKYAAYFILENGKLKYKKCELSLNSYHSARFLLAEYFRKKHAERSETFMQTDNTVVQMFSEIKRLTLIVAEICRLHGADFKKVMEFYNYENGIEDYCHPRFVACMLRIGDLLDFDSSRVSRFLLEHLSFSIPEDSKIHNEKNFCIKHALVTPEKVDVHAECSDVNTAFEIDKWFSWIRDEMSNQRNLWHDIAPTPIAKGYPMLGKLETKLIGGYDTINNNFKPQFEIEGKKVIELLQGGGLYNDKCQCIREILQNAIDATYIRIYLENKEFASESLSEGFKKFVGICKYDKYQIEVNCQKINNVWHFDIQDNGIGILKEDLKYLLKIGSGRNNKRKFEIVDKMPEYAKPSGIFGIGFQSVFLITDNVRILTRSAFDIEEIDLQIGTPLKDGFAILKTQKNPNARIGTKISFDLKDDVCSFEKERTYTRISSKYDFVNDSGIDNTVGNILEEISMIGKKSYLKILCNVESVGESDEEQGRTYEKKFYKDDKTGFMVEISPKIPKKEMYFCNCEILYRNEHVDSFYMRDVYFVNWELNILSGNSNDILLVSRNAIKTKYVKMISEMIKRLGVLWLIDNWNNLDEKEKRIFAIFLEYYGNEEQKEQKNIKKYWEKAKFFGLPIKEIGKFKSIALKFSHYDKKYDIDKKNKTITCSLRFDYRMHFLAYVLEKYYGYHVFYKVYRDNVLSCAAFEVEFNKLIENKVDWYSWLKYCINYGNRSLMPCFGYSDLEIKVPEHIITYPDHMNFLEKNTYPKTVCPFKKVKKQIIWDCSDKLCEWVYKNRCKSDVTIEEIRKNFDDMKKELDKIVKKINSEREKPYTLFIAN